MPDASNAPDESDATIWLWQWNRTTHELEKVGVPTDAVPPDWVQPLQRHYAPGDRVLYTIDDEHGWQPGTVVKDQGMYVAIDGDAPGRFATTHKTLIQPLTEEPNAPNVPTALSPTAAPVASPHADPEIRTSHRSINARWHLGEPIAPGARWHASLTVHHASTHGRYRAVLRAVLEQRTTSSVSERWSDSEPAAVLFEQHAPRYSAKCLRDAYDAALRALRQHFDAGDPTITGYFTIPASAPVN